MRSRMIEQVICDLTIMCLPSGQTELDRDILRIDDVMDFRGELAA